MSTLVFDTHQYIKKLREAGMPEKQAEVQSEALKEIIDNNLATKNDIEKLSNKIERLELTLTIKFGALMVIAVGVLAAIIKL